MKICLDYGEKGLWIDLPEKLNIEVIQPRFVAGLANEKKAVRQALREPIGVAPLRELVNRKDCVAIVFSDITRPMPNRTVLPALLEELSYVPRSRIVLINALGTHQPMTEEELESMLGREVTRNYRVLQHDSYDKSKLVYLGKSSFGHPVWINRFYMEASVRILTGLIGPHDFAGFSGGPKAVLPGIAGEESILGNHQARMVGHPKATWGITAGNPVWEEMLEVAVMTQPTFLLNVSLNRSKEIIRGFGGDMKKAHSVGVEFMKQIAMIPVIDLYDIVITSNSGYPLDMNLYQSVKGMSAAAQIVREGGSIILAAECRNGIPESSEFGRILKKALSPQALLQGMNQVDTQQRDQWSAQVQALAQLRADIYVKSTYLTDEQIRSALLKPCHRIEDTLERLLVVYGQSARIAVLPEGPQTIPYVSFS